jgi:hypothetical protein
MRRVLITIIIFLSCATTAVADDARLKACQKKLKKAQELDMLVNIKVKTGHFDVIVGPTFYSVPFDAKEGFAETLNCLFNVGESGPKSLCNDIRFINWRTGNEDGKYSWCKLEIY